LISRPRRALVEDRPARPHCFNELPPARRQGRHREPLVEIPVGAAFIAPPSESPKGTPLVDLSEAGLQALRDSIGVLDLGTVRIAIIGLYVDLTDGGLPRGRGDG
jgi:hypothetical protein